MSIKKMCFLLFPLWGKRQKQEYLLPSVLEAKNNLFWVGLTGIFFNCRQIIGIINTIELTLLSINLLMLTFAAATERAIGLAFLTNLLKTYLLKTFLISNWAHL